MSNSPADLNTPRRRLSFSLSTLLGIVAFLCLLLAYVVTYRELPKARKEIVRLRNQVGELSIDDDTKTHVIAVDTLENRSWRWRLFLPKGTKYRWGVVFDQIPASGLAPSRERCLSGVLRDGEQLMDVKIFRGGDGLMHVTVKAGAGSVNRPVGKGSIAWSKGSASMKVDITGRRKKIHRGEDKYYTAVMDPDRPVVLLRYRIAGHVLLPKKPAEGDPCPGIMVLLEPVPPAADQKDPAYGP